jgi:hypothetical protein
MTFWTWIQEHQTLTAGITGFAGVIFTLWFNAWQARKQHREEQDHERQTLRVALREELAIHLFSINENLKSLKEGKEKGGCFIPTDPMDDGYQAFTDRIGQLSQEEVRKVMYAYLSLRTHYAKLFLIGVPPHTGDRHVKIPAENFPMLSGMLENIIGPIEEAIEVMDIARDAG